MKNHVSSATNYFKNNKVVLAIVIAVVILTVGAVAYGQSNKSALQRKQLEADAKLASQIEDSKKANEAREAKIVAQKKAAKVEAEKAAAEAAAKKAAEEAAAAQAAQAAAATAAAASSINLTYGTPYPKEGTNYYKIPVSWTSGFNSEKGFKLVWNTTGSPTYPGSNPEYHEGGTSGSSYIKVEAGGTYYIRVCQYLGDGTCGAYSNQVAVTL